MHRPEKVGTWKVGCLVPSYKLAFPAEAFGFGLGENTVGCYSEKAFFIFMSRLSADVYKRQMINSSSNMARDSSGQRAKSAVTKPVVLIMEAT